MPNRKKPTKKGLSDKELAEKYGDIGKVHLKKALQQAVKKPSGQPKKGK